MSYPHTLQHTAALTGSIEEALNLSTDAVLVYEAVRDEEGNITDYVLIALNDAATGIFDMSREAVTGQRITDLWPGIADDEIWPHYAAVVESRKPYHTEVKRTTPVGETLHFEVTLRPYSDGFAISFRNISDFKEALEQSEAQKAFYEELILQGNTRQVVMSAVYNAAGEICDFRYEYLNYGIGRDDAHRHLPDLKEAPLPGRLLSEFLPSIRTSTVWDFYCGLSRTGIAARTEVHYAADGIEAFVDVAGKRLADGRLLIAYSDISHTRKIADELATEKARLKGVLEHVPMGITVFEALRDEGGVLRDLRLVRRNEKAAQLSRIPVERYKVGSLISELMPPELAEYTEAMFDVVRTGEPLLHELYQPHLDIWISSRVIKFGDGLLCSIQDITDDKKHAQEMQRQAELLEGILQASPHAILVFEAIRDATGGVMDFRIVRCNRQAESATGLAGAALSTESLFASMPELGGRLQRYIEVIERREPESFEFFDGASRSWRRITNTPLGDGFVMTMEDITEQKLSSQKTEETARLLNAVLDASPIAIVLYEALRNAAGEIVDFQPVIVNREALEISGYTAAEFLNMTYFERAPGSEAELKDPLTRVVTERSRERFEHEVQTSGRWVNSTTTPFGDGFIATSQDITDLKRKNRIIEDQAELFNGVMSSLQNGLSILRIIRDSSGELLDLEYIDVADSVVRDTGIPREETIGRSMRSRFPGIEDTEYWRAYREVARSGEPRQLEVHFTLSGYDNHLLSWVTPLGPDKLVSVYYIINDLKRTQRELEHTISELRRSNDDLEQFASIASHDLQEPLRKVQSFGNMLEARYLDALGDEGQDLVRRMQSAAGRMRDLVTGLLDFASLSRARQEQVTAVDTEMLIREIIIDLDHALHSSHARIRIEDSLPAIRGIQNQLRHLFHNLLTNAIKFRKADVSPLISIRALKPGAEDAEQLSPMVSLDQYVRIEISDNGIGFDPAYADKIFGLFERLHGVSEYKGTGIGLSICRRVVERHDGAIRASGMPGVGATFAVLLPKA